MCMPTLKTCIVDLWSLNNPIATHNQKISSIFRCNILMYLIIDQMFEYVIARVYLRYLLQLVYYSLVDLLFHVRTMVMKGAQTRKEFLY